jgi:3-hydroxypropanoate dehydrogenase
MNITTEQLFDQARTHSGFKPDPVSDALLHQLYELMKWGPTSSNTCPARIVFVTSHQAKAKLLDCVTPGNVEKTRSAPVTAIVGADMAFYEHLPMLAQSPDAKSKFIGNPKHTEDTALRNASLQGGYFIMAARSLGLDCGPMGGFDAAKTDAAFWAGTSVRTVFLCNLGQGDPAMLKPRKPRLTFEQACRFA